MDERGTSFRSSTEDLYGPNCAQILPVTTSKSNNGTTLAVCRRSAANGTKLAFIEMNSSSVLLVPGFSRHWR